MVEELKDFVRRTLDEMVKDMPLEKRLEGLTIEQRLQGLSREELRALLEVAQQRLQGNGPSAKPQ